MKRAFVSKTLDNSRETMGAEHSQTMKLMQTLLILEDQGKLEDAEILYESVQQCS